MSPVRVSPAADGAIWRVSFGGGTGNILDGAAMDALRAVFEDALETPRLAAVVLTGEGDDFSFGASVPEHLPGAVEGMLRRFRALLLAILDSAVVVLPAIRGRCLGGGLELAAMGHRLFAARGASFGQPEIALGVFAPAASLLLPLRIRRAHAEDLCLTGRIISAGEAHAMGLVDEISADPDAAAVAWATTHLIGRSASSLRLAVRAIRTGVDRALREDLPQLEEMYLRDLMSTDDAQEGLRAFLDKRPPKWTHGPT
jgi:cyclohexa-1,5-dienecarbonyl-CoA hydratase